MAAQFVVGLFSSRGIALDAYHRLHTEGVPKATTALVVLHEVDPVPEALDPELAALSLDPLVIGNVRESFARFIRNGETAVFIRAETAADAVFASDVIKLYAPLAIQVVPPQPIH